METNPNPILHFNERPGASPDYRFDYVETNINLGVLAARREEQGIYKNWFWRKLFQFNSTPDSVPAPNSTFLKIVENTLKTQTDEDCKSGIFS